MSKNHLPIRQLPVNVIHETMLNSHEPNEMAKKFSSPNYEIKSADRDQIAFSYMNLDAQLFWLPKFIEFIKKSKYDGYIQQHIDTIILRLADRSWVSSAQEKLSKEEKNIVVEFLNWIHTCHSDNVNPHVVYATYLWQTDSRV